MWYLNDFNAFFGCFSLSLFLSLPRSNAYTCIWTCVCLYVSCWNAAQPHKCIDKTNRFCTLLTYNIIMCDERGVVSCWQILLPLAHTYTICTHCHHKCSNWCTFAIWKCVILSDSKRWNPQWTRQPNPPIIIIVVVIGIHNPKYHASITQMS